MATYIYDGSFEGLLSCIFTSFKTRIFPDAIVQQHYYQAVLLDEAITVATDEELAERVLQGINRRTDGEAAAIVYKMFLSELPQVAMTIFHFIRVVVSATNPAILKNFADLHILKAAQIEKMIGREIHRMHAFVRFQKTNTGLFYAVIEPDFNVMPLLGDHFVRRYADQVWAIYDTRRRYGIYYDLENVCFITANHPALPTKPGELLTDALDDKETLYQTLWTNYFHSVNIQERKNTKLHLRHMPKRYWKYLIEKSPVRSATGMLVTKKSRPTC